MENRMENWIAALVKVFGEDWEAIAEGRFGSAAPGPLEHATSYRCLYVLLQRFRKERPRA